MKNYATLLGMLLLTGCGIIEPMVKSEKKLALISLGDSKESLVQRYGAPNRVRAAKKLDNGSILEIHEHLLYHRWVPVSNTILCPISLTLTCWFPSSGGQTPYWFQFVDGKLDKWGRPGDWDSTHMTLHAEGL